MNDTSGKEIDLCVRYETCNDLVSNYHPNSIAAVNNPELRFKTLIMKDAHC